MLECECVCVKAQSVCLRWCMSVCVGVHVMYMCATACAGDAGSGCCRRHRAQAMPSTPAQREQPQHAQASRAVPEASPQYPQDKRADPTPLSHLCHDKQGPMPQHSTQYVLFLPSTQETQSPL